MPDQTRQTLAGFKMNFESSKNAKTETVQGIEGHTREIIMTMDGPMGPIAKTTMHIVSAGADQAVKFPAIWEYNGYLAWSVRKMNPVETMRPLLGIMPGMGDGLAKLIEDGAKEPALMLKTEITMSMAMLGTEPVMHLTQTLTEISTAPIDDALFRIPTGFNEATVSEIMQALMKAPQFMPVPPPPSTPAIQVSSGDQSERLLKKVAPVYPELAKSARIQGVVKFNATINADGTVSKLELISGHPLLIPAARDAVLQWVYQTSPTSVQTDISVNFTLQD
jgi:TonB family protein